jgi:FkbM family methyltransferase
MTFRTALKKTLMPCIGMVSTVVSRSKGLQKGLRKVSFPGKGSIVRELVGLPKNIKSRCSGINYFLHLNDLLQREIYFNEFDRKQLPHFISIVPSEGVCFDIGANVGFYSLHMSKKLGAKGRVFSFEPNPNIFQNLAINCSLNPFANNIQKFNYAISNQKCRTQFFLPPPECSGSGSLNLHASLSGGWTDVHCFTLDEFTTGNRIDEIVFIKIDVEGAEFEVIKGAHQLMTEKRIKKIYVEFNGDLQRQKGHSLLDFLNLFASYDYFPDACSSNMLWKFATKRIDPKTIVTDFVFMPEA